MAEVRARTTLAKKSACSLVEGDVAAVDAEDRGDARQQAGFDRAEFDFAVGDFVGAGVVEHKQPTEEVFALADRHRDQFADGRVEPGGRAGGGAIEHERFGGNVGAEPLDEAVEFGGVERAIAVIDQQRAVCIGRRSCRGVPAIGDGIQA